MRAFFELFVVILIGLSLGGALSWISIQNSNGFGALKIGAWTAWPTEGSVDADPYSKAKVAAGGEVPLGAAEGLALHAATDQRGDLLQRNCQYLISGQTPPARLWTLSAHEPEGEVLLRKNGLASNKISRNLIREPDGSFYIQSGPNFASGNWLETQGSGNFEFILRLYDSPITSTRGIVDPEMPTISLLGCNQ